MRKLYKFITSSIMNLTEKSTLLQQDLTFTVHVLTAKPNQIT